MNKNVTNPIKTTETMQWEVMQNPIGVSYLSQFTADAVLILATWKREVEQ